MRDDAYWKPYLEALDEALTGDARGLWTLGEQYAFGVDRVVFYASICSDLQLPSSLRGFELQADPLLETYASELALCPELASVLATRPAEPAVGAIEADVLVVASRLDPLTPAALLDSAPVLAERSSLCRTDVPGHTSFGDPRIGDLVREFLAAGDAAATAARC